MILDIITLIRDMVKMVNPLAVFECDQARMLNVKVDTMERFVTDSDNQSTNLKEIEDSNEILIAPNN